MEDTSRSRFDGPRAWDFPEGADDLAVPTILLVEDDPDIREMMTTLLQMAGFAVVSCETAECGLNALREQEFDLILTDYALPRQSGMWLLENAEAEGLIPETPVLIVTAHPYVDGAGSYEVVQKPFDLDDLVERVRRRTEGDRGSRRRRATPPPPMPGEGSDGAGTNNCPEPVELILYVSSQSPRSYAALRNIRKVLERFESSQVKLTVCDLSEDPASGIEDAVAFTPTLVRRTPGPRTFILGHITNPELLLELLADCDPIEN
jgi:DNA-binding response OmpR family regulator